MGERGGGRRVYKGGDHYLSYPDARRLRSLLEHLASGRHDQGKDWDGGRVRRVAGGWSNMLYRVTGPAGDWAVKFTIGDSRDRAGREYHALLALRQAGLSVAPEPILLDRGSYEQPVVVQTWLDGEVRSDPPCTEADWERLLEHLTTVHSVKPGRSSVGLRRAVVDARSVEEGRAIVREEVAKLPRPAQPSSLQALVQRFERTRFPGWSGAEVALCRSDNNTLNLIRRPGAWASVDWENAGWGDPAFDLAQLMTHPAYEEVPCRRWEWAVETYCSMGGDEAFAVRAWAYYRVLAVWWAARVARLLYEVPRGMDERLVDRPEGWEVDINAKYAHYLKLAKGLVA